ncbi:MAG: STAS domain-containing protein [Thiobacillus sp.]|nr:STAS domain-containing protein [Thiobacillus sp.]
MIACDQSVCRFSGPLTVDTVGSELAALRPHLARGITRLDFSGVHSADSAALALIFGAQRAARAPLTLSGLPESFVTLAELYGVSDLLPA